MIGFETLTLISYFCPSTNELGTITHDVFAKKGSLLAAMFTPPVNDESKGA